MIQNRTKAFRPRSLPFLLHGSALGDRGRMLLTAPGKGPLCSKENSMSKKFVAAGVMAASLMAAGAASATPTEITMWHAMANTLGDISRPRTRAATTRR